ncbi:bi-domain-containing oxidoreductase [Candidatus Viridilinea mediisalina]|uniref:Dehydrogenase n=1 Tax=Candidatus Viridilinea mediisalina TaxID=2024553 RepID=A0A2A6RGF8_9CHLR|nr:bi-domain-containing oxidoreductase [Candidatus Viridilinea mediisalina]PDW02023.1 dehydrogenase [Candidatus Viridilinea mediisalina]
MHQIIQNLKTGATELLETPPPRCGPGKLLIATQHSLISAGTERMLVEFGQGNLLAKARSQPDKVRQVLAKIQTDGLLPTLETVFARLDQPLPLGYCNAGVVLEVGAGVRGFRVGDRVVSNGSHAEVVAVPQNLCARIPEPVATEAAAFTVLAAVALQGVRLVAPTLGERVVVLGLGLLGLLTVQLLRANGCHVLGMDFDAQKCALARQFGAEALELTRGADPVAAGMAFADGRGVDAVLITAATKSNAPIQQAAQMSRKRGRIVLVGVTGLELSRADFYEKELTFQVSCSYGPGRYDESYEQQGHDYPFGLVRWTEQRNFEAILGLLADGRLDVRPLISRRVPFVEAPKVYKELVSDRTLLGVVLGYGDGAENRGTEEQRTEEQRAEEQRSRGTEEQRSRGTEEQPSSLSPHPSALIFQPSSFSPHPSALIPAQGSVVAGVIGAGNFASLVLIPALAKSGATLHTVATSSGRDAALAARKFGFVRAVADYREVLADPAINTVFIATRHNSHARMVIEALIAGKHVFVEKPLALTREELTAVAVALHQVSDRQLLVGFNRRFAPLAVQMRQLLATRSEPLTLVYTVNAGAISANHWTQDALVGGGRIIGEGCHFVDLLRFLVGHPIREVVARSMGAAPGLAVREDKMTLTLSFADGSLGTIHYFANGSKQFPKERIEVFSGGRILSLDNFQRLRGYGWPGLRGQHLWRQDKGHAAELAAFVARVRQGGTWLIPWEELQEVSLVTFSAVEQSREG